MTYSLGWKDPFRHMIMSSQRDMLRVTTTLDCDEARAYIVSPIHSPGAGYHNGF